MNVIAKVVPFSSVVGSSVTLHDDSGKVVGQLGVMLTTGKTADEWKTSQVAVATLVADAINLATVTPKEEGRVKPQDMEYLEEHGEVGDCVRAATATLLGIDRGGVPHFVRDHVGGWRGEWEDWLEARGFIVIELDPRLRPQCKFLACGPTIRDGCDHPAAHMVVMEGVGLHHDPHPSRAGIVTADRVYVVAPLTLLPAATGSWEAAGREAAAKAKLMDGMKLLKQPRLLYEKDGELEHIVIFTPEPRDEH